MMSTLSVDRTWQIHLNGLLALLGQPNTAPNRISTPSRTMPVPLSLLEGLYARLWKLAPCLDSIFHSPTNPRKIDVYKLRKEVKKIYRDILVAYKVLERELSPIGCNDGACRSSQMNVVTNFDYSVQRLPME